MKHFTIRNFVGNNFINLIVVILIVIVLLQRCGGDGGNNTNLNKTDTVVSVVNHYYKDSGSSKPIFIKGGRDTILESSIEYIPSDDYEELYNQFQDLKAILLSKNIQKDDIPIDTFGHIILTDTIQKNLIIGRGYVSTIKIPEKTITITNTIYPKPKNQWYVGGGISGDKLQIVKQIEAGLLFKNKKDQIFGIFAGMNTNGQVQYGVQSYWKIKLHK